MPTATAKTKRIYRVIFSNHGQVYEVYAKSVSQGSLSACVEVEGLLFGEKTSLVVDPSEESLQREFSGVERSWGPLHTSPLLSMESAS